MNFTSLILSLVFLLISGIHVYWAFGGKWGIDKVLPTKNGNRLFEAGTIGTLLVACIFIALFLWVQANAGGLNIDLLTINYNIVSIFLSTIFLIRAVGDFRYIGLFSREKSKFQRWDKRLFSPLCIFISAAIYLT